MQTGRNEACPCGSGKKFKNCCIGVASRRAARGPVVLMVAIGVIAAAGLLPTLLKDDETRAQRVPPAPASTAGKVWSPEHNHWHDAPAQASTTTVPARPAATPSATVPATTPQPQPPGPAPAGKVWSPEHGHWHDAAAR